MPGRLIVNDSGSSSSQVDGSDPLKSLGFCGSKEWRRDFCWSAIFHPCYGGSTAKPEWLRVSKSGNVDLCVTGQEPHFAGKPPEITIDNVWTSAVGKGRAWG